MTDDHIVDLDTHRKRRDYIDRARLFAALDEITAVVCGIVEGSQGPDGSVAPVDTIAFEINAYANAIRRLFPEEG